MTDRRLDLHPAAIVEAAEGPKWADLTSGTARGRVYQKIVKSYRTRGPWRPKVKSFERPAPDHVWMVARGILQHTELEPDDGERILLEVLAWCHAGDAPLRASRILTIDGAARPSAGIHDDASFLFELRRFLTEAMKTPNYLPRK